MDLLSSFGGFGGGFSGSSSSGVSGDFADSADKSSQNKVDLSFNVAGRGANLSSSKGNDDIIKTITIGAIALIGVAIIAKSLK